MDPFAVFALTFGMAAAASHQAAVMEHYAARNRYAQTVVVQPAWEHAPVAYVPMAPAPAPMPVARAPLEATPIARRSTSASREFTDHWQNFMQPSASR
jgi:hypothetical protein